MNPRLFTARVTDIKRLPNPRTNITRGVCRGTEHSRRVGFDASGPRLGTNWARNFVEVLLLDRWQPEPPTAQQTRPEPVVALADDINQRMRSKIEARASESDEGGAYEPGLLREKQQNCNLNRLAISSSQRHVRMAQLKSPRTRVRTAASPDCTFLVDKPGETSDWTLHDTAMSFVSCPARTPWSRAVVRRGGKSRSRMAAETRRALVMAKAVDSTASYEIPAHCDRAVSDPSCSISTPDATGLAGRRSFLGRAASTSLAMAVAPALLTTIPASPAIASSETLAQTLPTTLSPFVGKAGFFMRIPGGWVKAMDRSGDGASSRSGETLALVGNFKDIDTVSVRREPMSLHQDFAKIINDATTEGDTEGDASKAKLVADVLTSAERSAVEANQALGVVAGVEGGSSGVMDFRLGDASVFLAESSTPGGDNTEKTQPYFVYDFYTEVCRAKIEEISGGDKQCVGPRGDVLDTIQRRNFTIATESDGYLYLVKASALESRWADVGGVLREIATSFRVPQKE